MMIFPRAFAFAVDDLGWNEGGDLSVHPSKGPFRCGVKRTFDLRDYKYIIDVGKAVNVRINCLFILGEMDRENVLAQYPTTTWQREKWNNSKHIRDEQLEIMSYVCRESAHMEFGFHGTGHEYWESEGVMKRAEWYNMEDKQPWPEQIMLDHIEAFRRIMSQYGLDAANGHSFPNTFVACNYGFYWNPSGEYSLGKLLSEAGVKYANNDFSLIPELSPPGITDGGFDHGTHVISHLNYGNHWYELGTLPRVPVDRQVTDVAESHWVNWLAQDDFMQPEVTRKWIDYYKNVQQQENRYVAKNTEQLHAQWLYKKYTVISTVSAGVVSIDNTRMPEDPYTYGIIGNMVLKIQLEKGRHVSEATIDGKNIPAYFEDEGYGYLYLPPLQRKIYQLRWIIGNELMNFFVWNDGTYNVYDTDQNGNESSITLKMYGLQCVKIKCPKPQQVFSATKGLAVKSFMYQEEFSMLHIFVEALDFQGQHGRLSIRS